MPFLHFSCSLLCHSQHEIPLGGWRSRLPSFWIWTVLKIWKSTPATISGGGPIGTIDYVRDEIVGFFEVSERQYGCGDVAGATREKGKTPNGRPDPCRPFLTNLSVANEARRSTDNNKGTQQAYQRRNRN